MSSTLPSTLPHPSFEAARAHAAAIGTGVKLTIASCLALGLELNRLKVELGYTHGGPSSSKANLVPWTELVARETGFCYDRCNKFCKTAEAVRALIMGSRKKTDLAIKPIVTSPPAAWSTDDYVAFAEHVALHFHAETFKELMQDLGLLPQPLKALKPEPLPSQTEFPFAAMQAAHDCIAVPLLDLNRSQVNPIDFTRHLYELPIDDQEGDIAANIPRITGLKTLSHILTQTQDAIAEAIKAKRKGAQASLS